MLLVDCGNRKIEVHKEDMYIVENNQRTLLESIKQLTDDEKERLYMLSVILG